MRRARPVGAEWLTARLEPLPRGLLVIDPDDGERAVGSCRELMLRPIFDEAGAVVAFLATLPPNGSACRLPTPRRTSIGMAVRVRRRLARLARTGATVLLVGEPGTGKASVARAIHRMAGRRGSFEERSGCELGADSLRALWCDRMRGHQQGTLYLADVDSLDSAAQGVLQALSERHRAGRPGWRLIVGTSHDLGQLAANGLFRRDLLARWSAATLRLPPLRERPDLARIARILLQECTGRGRVLAADALARLAKHPFPGNLDELAQVLRHASLMAEGATVRARDLPALGHGDPGAEG